MGFNRLEAKLSAKESMRTAYPHPMLVTLVYFLATTILVGVIQLLVANPLVEMYMYLLQGYPVEEVYNYYMGLMFSGKGSLIYLVSIVLGLYSSVMRFGYVSYALRLARREQPNYRNLVDGFSMMGRVLGTSILTGIFTALWMLLGMVPFFILVIVAAISESIALLLLAYVFYIGAIVWGIIVSYRYRLANYFLLDHPENGSLGSITLSKRAMKGRKMDLFVLDLSFLGWDILSVFTLGILGLWLSPYRCATEANFYDWATGGLQGQGPAIQEPEHPV